MKQGKNTVNPEPYKWKEEYKVDISVIDEQHKKFLNIINELKLIINTGSCTKKIPAIFYQIAYLIDNYFLKEEIYFKDCQYPNFEQHQTQHNLFIKQITQFQKDFENKKDNLCLDIYNYLEHWFNEHILEYDKEAAEFLKQKGVN